MSARIRSLCSCRSSEVSFWIVSSRYLTVFWWTKSLLRGVLLTAVDVEVDPQRLDQAGAVLPVVLQDRAEGVLRELVQRDALRTGDQKRQHAEVLVERDLPSGVLAQGLRRGGCLGVREVELLGVRLWRADPPDRPAARHFLGQLIGDAGEGGVQIDTGR